jgi:hypothetical protein
MFNFAKWPIALVVVILNGYIPMVSGDSSVNRRLAVSLEEMLPSLVSSEDYRTASNIGFQVASARQRLGETRAACAALSQSLEYYRMAIQKETGVSEPAVSSVNDDSDGMAEVRAKFGCARA